MKKTETLATATAPDGTVLTLYRHDGDCYLRANGIELMSTRRHQSEEALADLGCASVHGLAGARVLIGGLGFGFTLRAALGHLTSDARVTVVELLGDVIAWNRDPGLGLGADALADPRVEVIEDDVLRVLGRSPSAFDVILLDVDNGAESFTTRENEALYSRRGVALAVSAMRPGGRIAWWLDRPDARFEQALRDAGLGTSTSLVRAHATSGVRHAVLVASRDAGRPSRT